MDRQNDKWTDKTMKVELQASLPAETVGRVLRTRQQDLQKQKALL
jgi:hypothetical protein